MTLFVKMLTRSVKLLNFLSPTHSDELNLMREYVQTFPTCVLTFFAPKTHGKQHSEVKIAFF